MTHDVILLMDRDGDDPGFKLLTTRQKMIRKSICNTFSDWLAVILICRLLTVYLLQQNENSAGPDPAGLGA